MSISGIETIGEQVTMQASAAGVRASARLASRLTLSSLKAISHALEVLAQHMKSTGATSGEMPLNELMASNRGDIHPIEIPEALLEDVRAEFDERGIQFSIEHGADNLTYVHFRGADADAVRRAIDQVTARVEKDLEPVKTTAPQTRADVQKVIKGKAAEKARTASVKVKQPVPQIQPKL